MANPSDNQRQWLVKSSGIILGPFTREEVGQELLSKKIALIDEVRSADSRWLFIREHRQFTDIVQKLRNEHSDGKEDTGTTFVGTKTITQNTDEMTITSPPVSEPDPNSEPQSIKKAPTVYGSPQDPKFQTQFKNEKKKSAVSAWLAVLLIVVVGCGAFQLMFFKKAKPNLGYDDYITLAKSNISTGNFEKALDNFRQAEAIRVLDIPHQVQMIPLLMVVENQNLQARQMLENLSGLSDLSERLESEIENLIALTYLRDGRLDEAQKRYFEIIQENPKNEAAQINLAEISVLQGQFDVASENITALIKSGFKNPILLIFRILVNYRITDDKAQLESSVQDLKRLVNQNQDNRGEMLLLLAALQKKIGQDLDAGETIRKLLSLDPNHTQLHVHDYMIHRELLEWVYLGNICEILIQGGGESPIYSGLSAYCRYKQNDLKMALDKIEKARTQFRSDRTLIGLHSYLLYRSNRSDEAKALVQLPDAAESDLALFVKASLCQDQRDWSCAETAWEKIHQNDPRNLAAFAGLAGVFLATDQKELAHDYFKQGLLISKRYRPLLELKERFDEP